MNGLTKTEQKYLDLLFDIENKCKSGQKFAITEIICTYNANSRVISVLKEKGIIKDFGTYKYPIYQWTTIRPNINMVRAVLHILRDINRVKKENYKQKNIIKYQELNTGQISEIIQLRDVKKKTLTSIAKKYNYSHTHLSNIYHAAKGSKTHREILNGNLKATIDEFLKLVENNEVMTTQIKAKPIKAKTKVETIKVAPRMHPVVESKQKSIVILWGLINIKF